jgi:hypothetical protein
MVLPSGLYTFFNKEYGMIFGGPGFLAVVAPPPTPPPSPVSKLERRHTGRVRQKEKLVDGRGG